MVLMDDYVLVLKVTVFDATVFNISGFLLQFPNLKLQSFYGPLYSGRFTANLKVVNMSAADHRQVSFGVMPHAQTWF